MFSNASADCCCTLSLSSDNATSNLSTMDVCFLPNFASALAASLPTREEY